MQITIHNKDIAEDQILGDVLFRVGAWWRHYDTADVYCSPRTPSDAPSYDNPGWLEYAIHLASASGSKLFVAAIQRQPGAKTEFHS